MTDLLPWYDAFAFSVVFGLFLALCWTISVIQFLCLVFLGMCRYMCIKDKPCKVSAVSTSKTGKHGHAKCNFTAIDIFTNKKYEDIIPATHTAHILWCPQGLRPD